jgi:O-antigen/teichoic acid export membrane protein
MLINLVIQAFKLAAEPFFFSISGEKNSKETYARVMKWFVILLTLMFLNVTLYMDIWKHFVGREYHQAIGIVPVLLLSYIFLGVYYNLTVWYKLTDKTRYGTYIMVIGSLVTVAFNWTLIPTWGYYACAWGTLLCYALMMALSYFWGQKYYPIPYDLPKLLKYIGVMLVLFAINYGVCYFVPNMALRLLSGTVFFALFVYYIYRQEREELMGFPIIGKYIR